MGRFSKKLVTVAIVMASAFTSNAQNGTSTTKVYDYQDFSGLSVSNGFSVNVVMSDKYSTEVTVPDQMVEYLDIKVDKGVLYVGFKDMPLTLSASAITKELSARISMPELDNIKMEGRSKLYCKDEMDLGSKPFNLYMAGASEITGVKVNAGEARVYVNGTAKAHIEGEFVEFHLTSNGTTRTELAAKSDILKITSSATANNEVSGEYEEITLSLTGVSNVSLSGKADELYVRTAGTSSVDALKMEIADAEADMAGTSTVKLDVSGSLTVSIAGSSSISYKDYENLKLNVRSQAKNSKLKKL